MAVVWEMNEKLRFRDIEYKITLSWKLSKAKIQKNKFQSIIIIPLFIEYKNSRKKKLTL